MAVLPENAQKNDFKNFVPFWMEIQVAYEEDGKERKKL